LGRVVQVHPDKDQYRRVDEDSNSENSSLLCKSLGKICALPVQSFDSIEKESEKLNDRGNHDRRHVSSLRQFFDEAIRTFGGFIIAPPSFKMKLVLKCDKAAYLPTRVD